jgi:hypothetical protein
MVLHLPGLKLPLAPLCIDCARAVAVLGIRILPNSTPAEMYSQFLQKMETPNRGAPGPAWPGLRERMFSRMEGRRAAISVGI